MKKGKKLYLLFWDAFGAAHDNNRWRGGIARARERQLGAPL
jgi:hypothetical protein